MWVATNDLPRSGAHPFSTRLNQILDQHDFDGWRVSSDSMRTRVGQDCRCYFLLLLIGYFEGLDAERAVIARKPCMVIWSA